jgi:hypothetical protein
MLRSVCSFHNLNMERKMKAITLFNSCLLACSVLAGAHATAGPSTVNSIEFSFMNYSSIPFTSLPLTDFNSSPSLPAASPSVEAPAATSPTIIPTPQEFVPVIELALPPSGPTDPTEVVVAPDLPDAALAVPEPGTVALLGLGIALLVLRRREGVHG